MSINIIKFIAPFASLFNNRNDLLKNIWPVFFAAIILMVGIYYLAYLKKNVTIANCVNALICYIAFVELSSNGKNIRSVTFYNVSMNSNIQNPLVVTILPAIVIIVYMLLLTKGPEIMSKCFSNMSQPIGGIDKQRRRQPPKYDLYQKKAQPKRYQSHSVNKSRNVRSTGNLKSHHAVPKSELKKIQLEQIQQANKKMNKNNLK